MKPIHEWYEESCDLLARHKLKKQCLEEINVFMKEHQETINDINEHHPEIKEWYMRKKEMQKSFTQDQINFICEQIGDWYLDMKPLFEGQHNLGRMKEKLKTMICGEA